MNKTSRINGISSIDEVHLTQEATAALRRWLCLFSWEGALANVFIILTGGAFLTNLALILGANDFAIGLLGAIPFLAQTAQLSTAYFIDLTGNRKGVTIWGAIIGRQIWWLMVPLLFLSGQWRLTAFLIIVVIASVSIMISTPGWMAWISDLVPEKIRGRYFGRRSSAIAVSTISVAMAGGIILDRFRTLERESLGYVVIVATGCLFALLAVLLLRRLPDPNGRPARRSFHWADILEPLHDLNYRHLLKVFFVWNMSIGISAAFFAAHMLTNLQMSLTQISLYSCAFSLAAVFTNRPWGKIIDRFGSKPVIVFCGLGIAAVPLIWLLPRPGFLWILWFEAVYSGMLWTGFNLAAFNIPIATSPREQRAGYLAMFSVITGLGFFIASLLGGALAESLSFLHWQVGEQTIVNYHILFVISSLMRLLSAFLFMSFHEPGEKSLSIMINFLGYAVLKQLSLGRQIIPLGIGKMNKKR